MKRIAWMTLGLMLLAGSVSSVTANSGPAQTCPAQSGSDKGCTSQGGSCDIPSGYGYTQTIELLTQQALRVAEQLCSTGNYAEAEFLLRKAVRLNPQSLAARQALARLLGYRTQNTLTTQEIELWSQLTPPAVLDYSAGVCTTQTSRTPCGGANTVGAGCCELPACLNELVETVAGAILSNCRAQTPAGCQVGTCTTNRTAKSCGTTAACDSGCVAKSSCGHSAGCCAAQANACGKTCACTGCSAKGTCGQECCCSAKGCCGKECACATQKDGPKCQCKEKCECCATCCNKAKAQAVYLLRGCPQQAAFSPFASPAFPVCHAPVPPFACCPIPNGNVTVLMNPPLPMAFSPQPQQAPTIIVIVVPANQPAVTPGTVQAPLPPTTNCDVNNLGCVPVPDVHAPALPPTTYYYPVPTVAQPVATRSCPVQEIRVLQQRVAQHPQATVRCWRQQPEGLVAAQMFHDMGTVMPELRLIAHVVQPLSPPFPIFGFQRYSPNKQNNVSGERIYLEVLPPLPRPQQQH